MNPEELTNPAIKDIARLVVAQTSPTEMEPDTESIPYVIIGKDQQVQGLEHLLPWPVRKQGSPSFRRLQSFITYVNEHKSEGSRIYVISNTNIVAILDHHGEMPQWGQHRPSYACQNSLEWGTWTKQDRAKMSQKDFCEFIEDNSEDIVGRTDMVELIRSLQINANVDYKSYERGDNGNCALSFVKTTNSRAGEKGEVELPATFIINIPAFEGGVKSNITAKLRFEFADTKLRLWYELQKLQKILNAHTEAVVQQIATATKIVPFYGQP